ncbi:MAG: WD40 repeat domain-containing protein [Cyanobacteria bacterium P01_H01_bin.35]
MFISKVLESGAGIFLDYAELGLAESTYQELLDAQQELANRGTSLETELEAGLEFVLGRAADNLTEVSLEHYQRSLELWQQLNNPLRVAHTNYYLGLWWRFYAVRHRIEKNIACEKACSYFQKSVEGFESVNRPDLVAKFINAWGEVLQTLERWDELENVANKAIEVLDPPQPDSRPNPPTPFPAREGGVSESLPPSPGRRGVGGEVIFKELPSDRSSSFRLARAYDFLAEIELAKSHYQQAKKLAQTAREIFHQTFNAASPPTSEKDKKILDWEKYSRLGRYLFSLAKAEKGLGEIKSAIASFEQAKNTTNPEDNAEFYIDILTELREIYYEQKAYLEAFEIKQEKLKVEQQFGFQAFIGANRLRDIKENTNPALPQSKQRINQQKVTQEIAAPGRQSDVEILVERISRPDHKLIVIHGQSGVGKSSILQAGLVPTLEGKSIATRDVVVVLQRVYVNWISELGKLLAEKLQIIANLTVDSESLNSTEAIFTQLRNNANDELNLLTVINFDQFEEFFFENSEPKDKREFAQFLQECLKIPFVKVVLSLRSDYIHYLLDFNRLGNLEAINNNILDKNILYYLGNFEQSQAKLIIQGLTANSQFKIDENLTEKLVEDLAQELGEIRPIELQVVGAQLQSDNITTVEKYLELGDNPKAELVEEYLASVVRDCGEENEKSAWLVLLLLTDKNNTRPLKTKAELVKESKFRGEKLELVLKIFVDSGLVFLLPENPADRYQLVHDYLVRFIRQKKEVAILEELKREREQRQQLQKWLFRSSVIASLLMTLLAGGMIIFALREQREGREANKQAIIAQANEARTLSISGERFNSLIIAMEARQKQIDVKLQPTGEVSGVASALRLAVYKHKKDDEFTEFNSIEGHKNWVNSVAFSPDGETIATASNDKTVKLWNRQGQLLQTLIGHDNWVNGVAFSPDGETIASASEDKTVKLWNQQGQLLQTLTGHENKVNSVVFSPNGEIIASASEDKTVKLWNQQGQLLQTLTGHQEWVNGVAFSPDGETIATASEDKTVKLWNRQGKVLKTLTGHKDKLNSVAFSPDGETIASASRDNTVKLWHLQRKKLQTLEGHDNLVRAVVFSPDGKTIATASADNTVKLWNREGKLLQTLTVDEESVNNVAFSPDGEIIASANGRNLKLWNFQLELATLTGHDNSIRSVAFSPDGETLASASRDNAVKLWNLQGKELHTLNGHKNAVWSVAFSPDGETLASASIDSTVKLWNLQGKELQTLTGHRNRVYSVAFSPDGETIASASRDKTVKLWNRQGQLLRTLIGHRDRVYSVAFSPDGETIASASWDETVKLWSLQGKELQTLEGHTNAVYSISFSPDGETIATASGDKTVKLWNLQGKVLKTLEGHRHSVLGVAFSSDGKTIASAGWDKTLKLWNREGKLLHTLEGHENRVNGVAFSPDGETIASASSDKTLKLWPNLQIKDLTRRGCQRLNDYLISHPQKLEELRICQTDSRLKAAARSWVVQAEKLARESKGEAEKLEAAVAAFKKALKWNPNLNLNRNFKAWAKSLAEAEKLMEEGTKLAREGKIEEAIEKYQRAKEVDKVAFIPTLQNIDPEAKAKYQAVDGLLNKGIDFLRQENFKEAIASYQQAEKIDSTQISADNWNTLCRQGSLNKQATDVMFACEKAVALSPKDISIIDSRGIARALTGDFQGANADFQVFVEWTDDEEEKAQRQEWIKALQAGANPFTDELLQELR